MNDNFWLTKIVFMLHVLEFPMHCLINDKRIVCLYILAAYIAYFIEQRHSFTINMTVGNQNI